MWTSVRPPFWSLKLVVEEHDLLNSSIQERELQLFVKILYTNDHPVSNLFGRFIYNLYFFLKLCMQILSKILNCCVSIRRSFNWLISHSYLVSGPKSSWSRVRQLDVVVPYPFHLVSAVLWFTDSLINIPSNIVAAQLKMKILMIYSKFNIKMLS